jgi:hypothetical protein
VSSPLYILTALTLATPVLAADATFKMDCALGAVPRPPIIVLGEDGGASRWAVTVDEDGRWVLLALPTQDTVCRVDSGTFLGLDIENFSLRSKKEPSL